MLLSEPVTERPTPRASTSRYLEVTVIESECNGSWQGLGKGVNRELLIKGHKILLK